MSGIDDCLRQAMTVPGAIGASLVDYTTGFALGSVGAAPGDDPDGTATGTAGIVHAAISRSPFASTRPGDGVEDVIITTAGGYHLIRLLRTGFDSRLALYLWLDKDRGNLAVGRRRLQMLAENLVTA
ncbi:hypothetical protein [Catenuloplanes indicus]|uniref:Uncharacterized protein n=1 Tax=Catenuloplanes indicus TaxID=137267 RepID=A0AAE3VZT0_9ACTN|nr:hypothetical protein [Catenuloplanes indicus]MDQ0366209.1 hypothetical protein [Catenuloplanes indicus]